MASHSMNSQNKQRSDDINDCLWLTATVEYNIRSLLFSLLLFILIIILIIQCELMRMSVRYILFIQVIGVQRIEEY